MKNFRKEILTTLLMVFISVNLTSQEKMSSLSESDKKIEKQDKKRKKKKKKAKLPNIDLSHWKITVPVDNEEGKPYEVEPPEILDYANNEKLKPYMYNDSTKGALVFYAHP